MFAQAVGFQSVCQPTGHQGTRRNDGLAAGRKGLSQQCAVRRNSFGADPAPAVRALASYLPVVKVCNPLRLISCVPRPDACRHGRAPCKSHPQPPPTPPPLATWPARPLLAVHSTAIQTSPRTTLAPSPTAAQAAMASPTPTLTRPWPAPPSSPPPTTPPAPHWP